MVDDCPCVVRTGCFDLSVERADVKSLEVGLAACCEPAIRTKLRTLVRPAAGWSPVRTVLRTGSESQIGSAVVQPVVVDVVDFKTFNFKPAGLRNHAVQQNRRPLASLEQLGFEGATFQ